MGWGADHGITPSPLVSAVAGVERVGPVCAEPSAILLPVVSAVVLAGVLLPGPDQICLAREGPFVRDRALSAADARGVQVLILLFRKCA